MLHLNLSFWLQFLNFVGLSLWVLSPDGEWLKKRILENNTNSLKNYGQNPKIMI